ncbi:MAG: flagellar hook-length control protein FliK [Phenylobacterium sp.]
MNFDIAQILAPPAPGTFPGAAPPSAGEGAVKGDVTAVLESLAGTPEAPVAVAVASPTPGASQKVKFAGAEASTLDVPVLAFTVGRPEAKPVHTPIASSFGAAPLSEGGAEREDGDAGDIAPGADALVALRLQDAIAPVWMPAARPVPTAMPAGLSAPPAANGAAVAPTSPTATTFGLASGEDEVIRPIGLGSQNADRGSQTETSSVHTGAGPAAPMGLGRGDPATMIAPALPPGLFDEGLVQDATPTAALALASDGDRALRQDGSMPANPVLTPLANASPTAPEGLPITAPARTSAPEGGLMANAGPVARPGVFYEDSGRRTAALAAVAPAAVGEKVEGKVAPVPPIAVTSVQTQAAPLNPEAGLVASTGTRDGGVPVTGQIAAALATTEAPIATSRVSPPIAAPSATQVDLPAITDPAQQPEAPPVRSVEPAPALNPQAVIPPGISEEGLPAVAAEVELTMTAGLAQRPQPGRPELASWSAAPVATAPAARTTNATGKANSQIPASATNAFQTPEPDLTPIALNGVIAGPSPSAQQSALVGTADPAHVLGPRPQGSVSLVTPPETRPSETRRGSTTGPAGRPLSPVSIEPSADGVGTSDDSAPFVTGFAPVTAPTAKMAEAQPGVTNLAAVDAEAAPELLEPAETLTPAAPAVLTPAGAETPEIPARSVRATPETLAALSAQMARRLDDGITRFELELNPSELGRVDVRLEVDASGGIRAAFTFERPSSASELGRRADELQKSLESAGFNLSGGLSFDVAGDRSHSRHSTWAEAREDRAHSPAAPEPDLSLETSTHIADALAGRRPPSRSGVDIRI